MIQPLLSPHNELKKIMGAGSLGTVRAITYMKDGQAKVILPLLRIPAGENITDNFSEGSKGNVVASVDLVTGVLSCGRMSITRSWPDMIDVRFHPDTAIKIEGFVIPYWKEAMELLLRAQLATPQLRTLGWDLAITDSGPVIVEVNTGYDSNLVQVAYGRGIRRDMAEIIGMSQILEGRAPE